MGLEFWLAETILMKTLLWQSCLMQSEKVQNLKLSDGRKQYEGIVL